MTPFHPGGTPNEISFYTTRRDATRAGHGRRCCFALDAPTHATPAIVE